MPDDTLSLPKFFDDLLRQLEIDGTLKQQITEMHTRITRAVQKRWKNVRPFFGGSYGRKTKIAPINDVDIFLVRDEECKDIASIPHQPEALLAELETLLVEAGIATREQLRRQRRSLGLLLPGWRIDLVPALRRRAGGFYIMDRELPTSWIFTDPEKHEAYTKESNHAASSQAVPLIKLLKRWRRTQQVPLGSFHLEVMILRALSGKARAKGFAEGVTSLFEQLASAVLKPCGDPGGSGGCVDNTLSSAERTHAEQQLREAWAEMKQALADANRAPEEALRRVRTLFAESPITEIEAIRRLELPLATAPATPTGAAPPPEGAVVVLDAELLLHAAGPPSAVKTAVLRLLERAARRQIRAAVDTHTLLELIRRCSTVDGALGGALFSELRRLPLEFWSIDVAAVDRLQSLRTLHPSLDVSAALSAALCLQTNAGLCSFKAELDQIPGFIRYEP